ncbi:MAG: hypothetical protein ACXVLQ_05350 [Bacteriovorax sp.]
MKSVSKISLCLMMLSSSPLFSRDIVLVENQASLEEGTLLKNILVKKFHLPQELITLRNIKTACETKSEAIVHLCLDPNGELQIKKMNQYVVKNSLGVFLNQANEEEVTK